MRADIEAGTFGGRVQTRFPPEPNGYLHVGHAKAICVDFGIAAEFGGICNLRYDDTNPDTEDIEFAGSIIDDLTWLGFPPGEPLYASDYFEQLYEWAEHLVPQGLAYVDDQDGETISAQRGGYGKPGIESPYRDRPIEENLDLFERMRAGEFADGSRVLRAKIDMQHENMQLRDPVMYRIRRGHHWRTGDEWVIYPTYDWAHGQSDAIEGVTHSLCTLEFDSHRALYDWYLRSPAAARRQAPPDRVRPPRAHPHDHVEASPRSLGGRRCGRRLGRPAHADAARAAATRLPARSNPCVLQLHRRRSHQQPAFDRAARVVHPPPAQRDIAATDGGAAPAEAGDHELARRRRRQPRRRAPRGRQQPREPRRRRRARCRSRRSCTSSSDDFMEDRSAEVLPADAWPRGAAAIRLPRHVHTDCVKDDDGNVIEVHCTYDPATSGGNAPDGRKVKSTMHWVSADHAVDATVALYDRLFSAEVPGEATGDPFDDLNPNSRELLTDCKVEPALADTPSGSVVQFERLGYFAHDPSTPLLFHRTVGLRDEWANIQKRT